ncbi:MAG: FKBP-type peptidyl-prolyl cis-trans isomerase [Balneolaceae bacterium]
MMYTDRIQSWLLVLGMGLSLALLTGACSSPTDANEIEAGADERYLQTNAERPGVVVTESGLQYLVVMEGSGHRPTEESEVRFDIKVMLIDESIIINSFEDGDTPQQPVNEIGTDGLKEALLLMKEGAEYHVAAPAALAYGDQEMEFQDQETGRLIRIHSGATILYEIKLLEVVDNPAPEETEE